MTGERDFQDQPDQLQFGAVAVDAAPDSGSAVAAVEPAGAMITPYAQEMLDTQPFRNYELKSCLASSQTSAVFKAKDMGMERTVALKAMRPWPGRDGAVEEFFSLAGSIARLRSAYAPRGCDAGRAGKDFYLAYAFVDGDTLADRLARRKTGRLTEKESLRVAGAVAAALDDLFSHG
ncbi:MAG: hypothetical protein LIP23_07585, partial [Planctomycetes bacterium]|nr:hypothetical protein [Planctomycetota bacterium]